MLVWLTRLKWRAQLGALASGELDAQSAERVSRALAADPKLAAEYRTLEAGLAALRRWPVVEPDNDLRDEIELSLAVEREPLRAVYTDLLDASGGDRTLATARRELAAKPDLAAELELLARARQAWRAGPTLAVPRELRWRIDRAIDREVADRPAQRVAAAFLPQWQRRLTFAGAVAAMLFGVFVWRMGGPPAQHGLTPAVVTSQIDGTLPPPVAQPATASQVAPTKLTVARGPEPTSQVVANTQSEPVRVAQRVRTQARTRIAAAPLVEGRSVRAVAPVAKRVVGTSTAVASRPTRLGPPRYARITANPLPQPATAAVGGGGVGDSSVSRTDGVVAGPARGTPDLRPATLVRASVVAVAERPTPTRITAIRGAMPEPMAINAIEPGSNPRDLSFASETREFDF